MDVRIPNGVAIYLFGSSTRNASPVDLDVLLVYDPIIISSDRIYDETQETLSALARIFGRPVHPVLLTLEEEASVRFVESEKCKLLEVEFQRPLGLDGPRVPTIRPI
jgi:predicted nucleotidyltransferase